MYPGAEHPEIWSNALGYFIHADVGAGAHVYNSFVAVLKYSLVPALDGVCVGAVLPYETGHDPDGCAMAATGTASNRKMKYFMNFMLI